MSKHLLTPLFAFFFMTGCDSNNFSSQPANSGSDNRVPSSGEQAKSPRLSLFASSTHHELGTIRLEKPNQTAVVKTLLRNDGLEPLIIKNIIMNCTCVDAKVDKNHLAPGETANLLATIRLGNSNENRSARLSLICDGYTDPVQTIVIDWKISNPLSTLPQSIPIPNLALGKSSQVEFELHWSGENLPEPFEVTLESASNLLKPRFVLAPDFSKAVTATGRILGKVHVDISAFPEEKQFREALTAELKKANGDIVATLVLPLTWTVTPQIRFSPKHLSTYTVEPSKELTQEIHLTAVELRPFEVLSVKSSNSEIIVKADIPKVKDMSHTINLRMVAPKTLGVFSATLEIETSDPEVGKILIPISGLVESKLATETNQKSNPTDKP